jgi:glycosyltransferase involved in cell wall biosynthesis
MPKSHPKSNPVDPFGWAGIGPGSPRRAEQPPALDLTGGAEMVHPASRAINDGDTQLAAEDALNQDPGWDPPTFLIFSDDWGRHPSSCQHLTQRLMKRHPIIWVNTIGTRPPRFNRATLGRALEKACQWGRPGGGGDAGATLPTNLNVLNPWMWPWFRSGFDRWLNRTLLLRQLVPVVDAIAGPVVALTTIPLLADLVGSLPVARWVYYCIDDFGEWPGLDHAPLREMEATLVRRADVLIAVSETLQEKLAGMGRSSHLLTHGTDLEHWRLSPGERPAPELPEGLEPPLIVFWGMVDRRMDVSFLERLGAELTRGTIVLVGPAADPDPALEQIPRLMRIPPWSYQDLPLLARAARVLIMPYADLPVTRAMQPLKLKEYLATNRPVVVRDLPATRGWADCLDLADTPESFSAAVRSRLEDGLPECQAEARRRLECEGWDEKATTLERWALGASFAPEIALCR